MSTPTWDDKLHVRTSQHARLAFDRLRLELRAKAPKFWGKRLTQEALVAALLMWAESRGADEIAKGISPFLLQLEALMGYEGTGTRANSHARNIPLKSGAPKKQKKRA